MGNIHTNEPKLSQAILNDLVETSKKLSNHYGELADNRAKLIDPIQFGLDDKIGCIQRKVCLSKMSLSYYADCGGNLRRDINEGTLYGVLDLIDGIYDGLADLYSTIFPHETGELGISEEYVNPLDTCGVDAIKVARFNLYIEHKKQNPGCMLVFRIDDHYELYFEDAINSKIFKEDEYDQHYDSENIIYRLPIENFKAFKEEMLGLGRKLVILGEL